MNVARIYLAMPNNAYLLYPIEEMTLDQSMTNKLSFKELSLALKNRISELLNSDEFARQLAAVSSQPGASALNLALMKAVCFS